jgi:ParB/RepB/Spo0J family partition protein
MKISDTVLVALARTSPDKLNPRQHFDEAAVTELAGSIRQHGIITNLVVRPAWCEGTTTAKELAAARPEGEWTGGLKIVAGERRWRAASEIVKAGELGVFDPAAVPVRITDLTDPEYEELTLAEQLARKELTPLEEARSFKRQLAYLDDAGKPRHTAESLARSLGLASPQSIYERLQLIKLEEVPAAAKALEGGKLGLRVATLIARIPDKESRATAAKEILKGNGGEPMTKQQATDYIGENFMRTLAGAPFNQEDPALCRETVAGSPDFGKWSGKCSDCPYRTGNNKALFGDVKRGDTCTRPACYEAKVTAMIARVSEKAKAEGKTVLSLAESARVFPAHNRPGELDYQSDLIILDSGPQAHLLKAVVKSAPTWREIVEKLGKKGIKVPVVVAFDQTRRPVECAQREPIMAAAEKAGEPIFRGKNEPRTKEDDEFKQRQKEEAEAGKLRTHCALAGLTKLHAVLKDVPVAIAANPTGIMKALLVIALDNLGGEGASLIGKWQGLKLDGSGGWSGAVEKWVKSMPAIASADVALLLLLAEKMRWHGLQAKGVAELAAALKVDIKAVEKTATAEFNAKKKPKPAAGEKSAAKAKPVSKPGRKSAGAKAVAAVKSSLKKRGAK